ncbi:holo-ACP synthase [Humidisolicoccus flavus]|uniref:holo-ACP synthase n=1 Tax=Humidisolicoccus flavus TaxID=3111414 RepID=UPI0032499A06
MILGLGVDLVDIARFERAIDRTPRLLDRLLHSSEHDRDGRRRTASSLAARVAAKEAAFKALGATEGISWHDVIVVQSDDGAPTLELKGRAAEVAQSRGVSSALVSMTHDGGHAVAVVVLES